MAKQRLAGWAASSESPEDISKRIKGLVIGASAIIIWGAAQFFNIELTASDIVELGTQLGIVGGAIFSLYGAGVWFVRKIATKTQ